MTQPGGISIDILADGDTFAEALTRVVKDALRDVQVTLDAKPLQVKVNIDTGPAIIAAQNALDRADLTARATLDIDAATAIAAAETALAAANLSATATVDLDVDITANQQAALNEIKALTDKTVKVKVDLDMSDDELKRLKSIAPTLRQIKDLTDKSVRVKVDLDMSEEELKKLRQLGPTLRNLRTATDKNISVKVNVDMSEEELKKLRQIAPALRSIKTLTDKEVRIRVNVDMDQAEIERLKALGPSLRALSRLADKDIRIKIDLDVDDARLAAIAAVLREIRSRSVRVNVDGADDANSSVSRLSHSLGGLGMLSAGLVGIPAAIAGIGGAAGAAAGLVGGLVAAAGALGPAFAAVGATAAVGLNGVKDAFSAFTAQTKAAGTEGAAQAKAIASAQKGAESAARSLSSAEKAAKAATEDVTRARKQATQQLEDMKLASADAALSEKEAALALKEAQKDARTATGDDREAALLRVERAQLTLTQAQERNAEQQAAQREAEEKGIENSDLVVAAKEKEAAANDQVTAAADQLAAATAAVAEAQNQASTSTQALNQALAKLAPNAREFVLAAHELGDEWSQVGDAVQNTMFEGLGATLTDVAGRVLPALQTGMTGVAGQLNDAAKSALNFAGSARGIEAINATFANTTNLLKGLQSGTGGFTQGLIDLTLAAGPHMEALGRSIASIGEAIGGAFSTAAASGQLDRIFANLGPLLEGIGGTLGGLVSALLEIADRVMPALAPLFQSLGETLKIMAPALGDLGKAFAEALTPVLPVVGQLVSALATGLAPVLPVIGNLISALTAAILPMIGPFSQIAQVLGTAIADGLRALAPSLGPLAQAFADLVVAAAPLIPVLAESLSAILQALAPALSEVFRALGPVIAQLAEQLKPVIAEMAPVLAEVAKTLGLALADAIRQLAPVLPDLVSSFVELLRAVVPILPELARLAAEILPPLINVLVQLTPYIIKIIDAFTWLVEKVIILLVMPALRDLKDEFVGALNFIGGTLEWFRETTSSVFDWIGEKWTAFKDGLSAIQSWWTDTLVPAFGAGLDKMKGWFQTGTDWIVAQLDRLRDGAAVPIRWLIENPWNKGLLKAWNAVAEFLPGVEPMEPIVPGFARGGGVSGPGSGTSDDILAWLSNGEHVLTAREVAAAGGQNIVYAIRDMIARGIPFEWNNGQLVSTLGRDNLSAYGAKVATAGIGNVSPEGLFDPLLRFAEGGAILPWMLQLQRGHEFAKAQNGRNYQWAGPRWVGDSFDCSGFMGSIIAAITGSNPWQRYWATPSFAGYPAVGAQGLVKNLRDGVGMLVGITDDPGGPGGGHTAGELRGIPELGIPAARVESGGALGDVHYGRGTAVDTFASLYGLPIGANGFFQPSTGGGSAGPSPADQVGFLERKIRGVFDSVIGPIRARVDAEVGAPPPAWRRIPGEFLTTVEDKSIQWMSGLAGNLGELLPGAWTKAQETGAAVLDALTPFDTGGIANGKGIMSKDTIEPERVLSPEQTRLFEALVAALQSIASGAGAAASTVLDTIGTAVGNAVSDVLAAAVPAPTVDDEPVVDATFLATQQDAMDAQGQLISDTQSLALRTESSVGKVLAEQFEEIERQLADVANRLTSGVLGPVVEAAMSEALGLVEKAIEASTGDITTAQQATTDAVKNIDVSSDDSTAAFGSPGSAFDLATELSNAVVSVANTASDALIQVGNDIAKAALKQRNSSAPGRSRGLLGSDEFSGGPLVDMIVRLTGVEIEVRDLIESLAEDARKFRGEEFQQFDENGQLISDTAALMERTASSLELVVAEQNRINRALIASVLRYLMVNVVLPVLTALLTVMITLIVTAIGAFIGFLIGGPIGLAIGAALGAIVGVALSAIAAGILATVGLGAGAAIDAFQGGTFDSGGVAPGVGLMPKNTIEPERVLSPRQTVAFEQLVHMLDRGGAGGGNRYVQVGSQHFYGQAAPQAAADDLLAKLN